MINKKTFNKNVTSQMKAIALLGSLAKACG